MIREKHQYQKSSFLRNMIFGYEKIYRLLDSLLTSSKITAQYLVQLLLFSIATFSYIKIHYIVCILSQRNKLFRLDPTDNWRRFKIFKESWTLDS